jgi:exonuclease VII small subunit
MKNENIPVDIKSKSLKEAKEEIDIILGKLESENVDLGNSLDDFQRLIQLNKHVEDLFKNKSKEISSIKNK